MTRSTLHMPDPHYQAGFYDNVTSKRLFAWIIDTVFVTILCLVLLPFTGFLGLFVWPLFWLAIGFAYRWVTISGGSATWGMRLMAIQLRTADGSRLTASEAFLHTLGYTLSMAFVLVQVVSITLMLTSARAQGLTDHVMGTVMINRRLSR